MKKTKLLAALMSAVMTVGSFSSVLAAAPSDYDGQSYESMGYTSTDSDGEFNLAVVANGDVKIVGDAMYIKGSIYSNGTIYVSDGSGNFIDGLFISGTDGSVDPGDEVTPDWKCEGYIHVNKDGTREGINAYDTKPEYMGAILDTETSFECAYEDFAIPEIANDLGDVEMNVYHSDPNCQPRTISEDTKIGKLLMNGTRAPALTIDTTNGDVTVVIDEIADDSDNPNIKVIGDNDAYIYIGTSGDVKNLFVNYDITAWPAEMSGSSENTHLYITSENDVAVTASRIAVADMTVNASGLEVSGATQYTGDIYTNAATFELFGDATVTGVVCAPNADSQVVGSGTLYGQLHTNTFTNNGNGKIIYKADNIIEEYVPTPEPTEEPAPTEDPAEDVLLPTGPAKDYEGFKYAYIFGYEPYDADGEVVLNMAPEEAMTREQICAMLVRVDDQYNGKVGKTRVLEDGIFNEDATADRWSYNALAAVAESQAFYGKTDLDPAGRVSRGEVARIVAFMLGINEYDDEIVFSDTVGNENEVYIKIVATAGYMQGYEDGTFGPDMAITRAEFCSMLNNIIGRTTDEGYVLATADGTPVTHETYHFADLSPDAWYYETVLFATSAFDGSYVDLDTRSQNIRNKLDGFDAQYDY